MEGVSDLEAIGDCCAGGVYGIRTAAGLYWVVALDLSVRSFVLAADHSRV